VTKAERSLPIAQELAPHASHCPATPFASSFALGPSGLAATPAHSHKVYPLSRDKCDRCRTYPMVASTPDTLDLPWQGDDLRLSISL
jgi:hypothetical protein